MPNSALNMAQLTGQWLTDHGQLPALKADDPRAIAAERALNAKLVEQQAGLEKQFMETLRKKGRIPGSANQRQRIVEQVMAGTFGSMSTTISDHSGRAAELGRLITVEDMGSRVSFRKFDERTLQTLIDRVYEFCVDTFERIKGEFAATLEAGYTDGLGIDDIAKNLREDFSGLRGYQLTRIARTEVQSAQNEGSHQTMLDYGVQFRQWISAGDDRVRDDLYSHVYMNGQVVRTGENYSNGMQHPGDRSGALADFINCRCREVPYIPGVGEYILTTPYYP